MTTMLDDVDLIPFPGLPAEALAKLAEQFRSRHFEAGEVICRVGEVGDSLFVIQRGVAEVFVPTLDGETPVQRLRRGDVVGEMALLTDEPRSATVTAMLATDALELDRAAFAAAAASHPAVFASLGRIVTQRLARSNRELRHGAHRGEAVAVIIGDGERDLAQELARCARAAAPGRLAVVDVAAALPRAGDVRATHPEAVVAALDDLSTSKGTVMLVVPATYPDLGFVLDQVDRAVVLATERETVSMGAALGTTTASVELFPVDDGLPDGAGPGGLDGFTLRRRVRAASRAQDLRWLARHVTRTKLGLALGAGGAKGYAHVGALQVLEENGHVVDYVAGCSIGAVIGMCLALGMTSAEIDATMRRSFTPETVEAMFNLSFGGYSAGEKVVRQVWEELAAGRTFADVVCPLVMLAVDLDAREPVPLTTGPLAEGLMAATALAGFVPPHERDGRRLIDALALVPVPTDAVADAGADVTVAVNLVSRRTVPAWPGEAPPGPAAKNRTRMLDVLLEVMEMAQLDASTRHAAKADVVVEPQFGPATWRDFVRADDFLAAGRVAMEEQLESLQQLAAT